jgi:asparagine synthase (glutamine-hydrolysing)
MGGFVLVHKGDLASSDQLVATAAGVFAEMGMAPPVVVDGPDYAFRYFPKMIDHRAQFVSLEGGRFLACVGTLVYGACGGPAALRSLAAAADLAAEVPRCRGHFVIVEGQPGGVRILRDACAALEVFHDTGQRVFSTSFLAVARTMARRVLRRQEAREFLFLGHTLGTETLIDGLRRLDAGEEVSMQREVRIRRLALPSVPPPAEGSRTALAQGAVDRIAEAMSEVGTAFGGHASLALSGGYDTRLLLALCRRIGVAPELFVYGSANSSDVVTASLIAQREGINVEHIDKARLHQEVTEADYATAIRQNYLDVDGLVDGGIFGPPTERLARARRHRDGAVALHGGGGESFRNFFGITEAASSTKTIARLFFRVPSGIEPRGFSDRAYVERIASKMNATLGSTDGRLSRHAVEALYPYFRYRFWIGRELGSSARAGYSYMPLFDPAAVTLALAMPTRFKEHGNLEAEMIRIADARLAGYPSNYGHSFAADAPWRTVLRDAVLHRRPAWLRRAMYRHWARPVPPARAWHEEWAGDLLDLDSPLMRELVEPASVRRSVAFGNACNLAYLIRDLAIGDLAGDDPT